MRATRRGRDGWAAWIAAALALLLALLALLFLSGRVLSAQGPALPLAAGIAATGARRRAAVGSRLRRPRRVRRIR